VEQPAQESSAVKRNEALGMVRSGRPINRVAQDAGISLVTLRGWISEERELQERAHRGNPDAFPHDCPDCGRVTKVNLRTGLLYSHTYPGLPRQAGLGKPPTLPPLRTPPETKPSRPQYYDGPSQSVPARPSGLPSLGKRR
jgi:hypothetical protein